MEAIKIVEKYAEANDVGRIETLVLEIGELSSVIPSYVEAVYPAAVGGTILEGAELRIEICPAEAKCKDCGEVFSVREHKAVCPSCGGKDLKLLGGREFFIKEIVTRSTD
jgi:hydrogenase nickel incorporation protein HypA/HybF